MGPYRTLGGAPPPDEHPEPSGDHEESILLGMALAISLLPIGAWLGTGERVGGELTMAMLIAVSCTVALIRKGISEYRSRRPRTPPADKRRRNEVS